MTKNLCFVLLLVTLLTALCAPTFAQTCSAPSFTQAPVYTVGSDIRSVAVADFNSDGRPDLAVANADTNNVTVLMKVGRGTPAISNTYAVGEFPVKVVTGDFTGDGKPDIIAANNSSFTISLLRNNGFGGFIAGGAFNTASPGVDIAVGDFNNNGTLDLAVAVQTGVSILLGNGQGGFSAPTSFSAVANKIIAADFNNDGKLDLAIVGNTTQIRLGNGAGQFVAASCELQSNSGGLAAGDVNGDGKLDLVRANILAAQIQIHPGDGAGCLGASTDINVSNFGRPGFVALADLNKDGKLDIVAGATVVLGNGDGTFGSPFRYGMGSLGADPGANTVVADFDGDSNLDIASASRGTAGILFGNGAGGFRFAVGPAERGVFGFAHADLNNDGKLDIVGMSAGQFAVLLGEGGGNFGAPSIVTTPGSSVIGPVIADFNGDTKLDVAVLDTSHSAPGGLERFNVALGNGLGGFGSTISTSFDFPDPAALAGGDLNGDGKTDLVTVNRGGGNNSGSISIGLSDGAGQFVMQPDVSVGTSVNPVGVAFADFNKDGKMDLAVPSGGSFSILLGNGAGGFAPATTITTAHASSIRAGDLDGDGNVDLVMVSNEMNGKTSVVRGDGLGGFGVPTQLSLGVFPSDITLADFNNDGKLDLAVAILVQEPSPSPVRSNIAVLLGNGAGTFGPPVNVATDRNAARIITADLNGDTKPDIITANEVANNLTVALNTCTNIPLTSFTISGTVTNGSGQGIPEVAMILESDVAEPQIMLTDQNGNYLFTYAANLSHNLKVTPAKAGFSFSPMARVFVSSTSVTGDQTASFTGSTGSAPGQVPIVLTHGDSQHALTLDAVTFVSEPFSVTNIHNFSEDQRTRITLFLVNVEVAGIVETGPVFEAQVELQNGQTIQALTEGFGPVPNFPWLTQVSLILPDAVANSSEIRVALKVRGVAANKVTVKIKP